MESMEKVLLRPTEAADLISVSRSKMYQLIAARQIPSVRVGSMVRVPLSAIKQLAQQVESGLLDEVLR